MVSPKMKAFAKATFVNKSCAQAMIMFITPK